jgi:hypothetical protein
MTGSAATRRRLCPIPVSDYADRPTGSETLDPEVAVVAADESLPQFDLPVEVDELDHREMPFRRQTTCMVECIFAITVLRRGLRLE